MKINKISFELFSHATEDINEVKKSLINSLPLTLRDKVKSKIKLKKLEGHFKESIFLIELMIKGKDTASLFDHIIKSLTNVLRLSLIYGRTPVQITIRKSFLQAFDVKMKSCEAL